MTYNQIIKLLRDFSEAHYILKSFGNGEPWEMIENSQTLDLEYPMMWAQDLPNTLTKGEEAFKFRMVFQDQVATVKEKTPRTLGETNINEVKSDMRQCATDLISYLVQDKNYPDIDASKDNVLTAFVDEKNDKLTGWYFDLTITQSFTFSSCDIPMDGITPPPPSGDCLDATILINGISFTTVPSGNTEDLVVKDTDGTLVGSKVGNEWIVPKGGAVCLDATQIIKDSLNNILYSNNIPSGDTEEQVISDATITNSNSTFNGTILAEGNLVLPDIVHTQTDGTPTPLPAQTPLICSPALDATQVIKDSDNVILYTNNISSGTSQDQVITDSLITNSNATFNDTVKAQDTYIITDTTYNVYLDGVLKSTINLPSQVNQTININWI